MERSAKQNVLQTLIILAVNWSIIEIMILK
jgi:hypothetical protein